MPDGAEPLADPAEAADIAEEEGDLPVLPAEEVGPGGKFVGQLGGEELLELHARRHRRLLLLDPRQARRDAAGQQLHEHGVDLRDPRHPRRPAAHEPLAVERPDHLALAVEDRRGHDGAHADQAGAHVLQVGLLPEGPPLVAKASEHPPARPPASRRGRRARRRPALDDPPVVALADQDLAEVEADDVDDPVGRPLEEVGRAGGRVEDVHDRLKPADQGLRLDPPRRGQLQGREPGGGRYTARNLSRLRQPLDRDPVRLRVPFLDVDRLAPDRENHGERHLGRCVRAHLDAFGQGQGIHRAEVLQADEPAGKPFHLDVMAGDGVLVEPGEGDAAPAQRRVAGVHGLGRVGLPSELDDAVELADEDLAVSIEHPDQHGKPHRVSSPPIAKDDDSIRSGHARIVSGRAWVPRVPSWEPVRGGRALETHGVPRRNPWHPATCPPASRPPPPRPFPSRGSDARAIEQW